MGYKIAICDDEKNHREILVGEIKRYFGKHNIENEVIEMTKGSEVLGYNDIKTVDIIFLDIVLGDINGIELSKIIKKRNEKILTIFVTGHPEYAVDAFEQFAFNYILKPVDKKIFEKVIDRAVEEIDKIKEIQKGRFFNLVNKKTMSSIPYKDLFYFEKRINKISVKLTNDEIEVRKTLKKIEEEIDTSFFIRCHKSFIVNKEKILYQQGDNLILLGCSDLIPIGKKYRENVMKEIGKMINIRE